MVRNFSLARIGSRWALLAAAFVAIVGYPSVARAIPPFANAQGGVSCQLCHVSPPTLNAYGRYILATNFTRGIDPHAQMKENERDAIAFAVTADGSNTKPTGIPTVWSNFDAVLSGGYLGPQVTYYAAVPIVAASENSPGVYQLWFAYDNLEKGKGSLQVGKFATPMLEPWMNMPTVSLQPYAPALLSVGENLVGIGENRWGVSYTHTGDNALVTKVAYVTDQGPIESAFNSQQFVPVVFLGPPGRQGGAYVAEAEYLSAQSRLTGGVGVMGGNAPLVSGNFDTYSREVALANYKISPTLDVTASGVYGHDNNPLGGLDPQAPASSSNAWSFAANYNPFTWVHFEVQAGRTNNGLGAASLSYTLTPAALTSYVQGITFSPTANSSINLYNVSHPGMRPTMGYEVAYTGPWIRHGQKAAVVASTGGSMDAASVFATHCAACHGATGTGGVGPNLHGITTRKSLEQTVAFIENPTAGGIMPKLYPSELTEDQVKALAGYIRGFDAPGGQAAPATGSSANAPADASTPSATTASNGADVFSTHCSACHGATGTGGVGPNLHGIANRKTLDATIAFIENPTAGGIMPKLYPTTLTQADVEAVASYIQTTFR